MELVAKRLWEVLGERGEAWLDATVPALGHVTPRSLLDTPEGVEKVLAVIGRIEHGVYS